MKFRRIGKHNYAARFPFHFCCSSENAIYTPLYRDMQEIPLDIFTQCGIIHVTINAVVREDVMAQKPKRSDRKEKALRDCGALNTHPVSDPLFGADDFFDSRDLVQVKYEMLRKVHKEGESVRSATASFGFSRPSFYRSSIAFKKKILGSKI